MMKTHTSLQGNGGNNMKKTYEKPRLEIITFEYDIQTENTSTNPEFNVGGWWS